MNQPSNSSWRANGREKATLLWESSEEFHEHAIPYFGENSNK